MSDTYQISETEAERLYDAAYRLGFTLAESDRLSEVDKDTDNLVRVAFRMAGLTRHPDWDAVDQVLDAIADGASDFFLEEN